jgi:hypothetical protein
VRTAQQINTSAYICLWLRHTGGTLIVNVLCGWVPLNCRTGASCFEVQDVHKTDVPTV